MFTVIMRSFDYGDEYFEYDSFEEALQGLGRLNDAGTRRKDGVERWLRIKENLGPFADADPVGDYS